MIFPKRLLTIDLLNYDPIKVECDEYQPLIRVGMSPKIGGFSHPALVNYDAISA
ncbi:MAG: hypothetical protein KAH07_02330 [Flavobacteriaceae bacterium]|nr:hypothetical protein [Flavobacteriaceae bacterium]